jgi:hypothetical protein
MEYSRSAALEDWQRSSRLALETASRVGWSHFATRYSEVLNSAGSRLEEIEERFIEFAHIARQISHDDLLLKYVEAMSVQVRDQETFVPSFSDQCLWAATQGRPGEISPFRGLYYAWRLSEIVHAFQKPRGMQSAFRMMLELLHSSIDTAYRSQKISSKKYSQYEADLRSPGTQERWDTQIAAVKLALSDIATPLKWRWIHLFPYPCVTSSHFYLSGIRFYHNMEVSRGTPDFSPRDRYCTQSTDSGLLMPTERYGMLLPNDVDPDLANGLIQELPTGCLMLDLSSRSATLVDRENLKYFENWSRLITAKAYSVVTEALSLHQYLDRKGPHKANLYNKVARGTFMKALSNNPMRTFYFDTGIIGGARAASISGLPKIQYVTTRQSTISKGRSSPGLKLLDQLLARAGDGIELYITEGRDWPVGDMASWTLIPIGDKLPSRTSCLWSVRGVGARKIAKGIEGLRRDAFLRQAVDPAEIGLEGVEAIAGALLGGTLIPSQVLLGVVLGGGLGTTANVVKLRNRANQNIEALARIPVDDQYHRVREVRDFPTVQ